MDARGSDVVGGVASWLESDAWCSMWGMGGQSEYGAARVWLVVWLVVWLLVSAAEDGGRACAVRLSLCVPMPQDGRLPIHYAAEAGATELVLKLADLYPTGLSTVDNVRRLPRAEPAC